MESNYIKKPREMHEIEQIRLEKAREKRRRYRKALKER